MMLSSVRVTSRNEPTRTISIALIFATSRSPRLRLSLTSYGARYRSPSLVKVRARFGTEMLTRTRVVSGNAVAKEEDLSYEGYGTRSSDEPDLPVEFADIRGDGSGWGKGPRIGLGIDIRTRGAAPTHDSGSEKKQSQAGSTKNQHERLIPYPVFRVSISFATCPENRWSAHWSLTMPSGKR